MKILLADDDADRAAYLARALRRDGDISVVCALPGQLLHDAVALHAPDVVLVDMTRPDRDTLEGVRQLSGSRPHPVVLFVDEDDPAFMEEAIAAGVCSYNVGSVAPAEVRPVLRAAVALFHRHEQTRAALSEAEARLQERALIDRAKAMLIRTRRCSEPEAYRWLQRQAMAGGRRLADVARAVLQTNGEIAP
ncbi:ANTAR domain-containing protein [Rhodovastum atsumiense]|uniref:ANTAR domain-containing protein n=1 Tax=Rhodovastum atsumiense TaxID=504468 RepID=A0A5M6ISV4_9PROT|nr:ANTAR domain-containing protein [Rhodovastum atsumiense]KAA5610525.1 ANTAR domain-containing protein [Rhodovastum atsumiense]CAH2605030.1 ANTAR domain-containing protein [Rhodovastum atsumiense]